MAVGDGWYAVYTRFQHEKTSAACLEKKGFEVFVPVYRAVHRWSDRNRTVILPLFPCYLFVRTGLHRKADVLQTKGIRHMVESAGRGCEVSEEEIAGLRRICHFESRVQPHAFWEQGDRVRIRRGPLCGIEGILKREKNEYRIVVCIELLKKGVSVEVDRMDVERLPEERVASRPTCGGSHSLPAVLANLNVERRA
ncbi:MAG TPA: UpxY family transcription antiterminator [Candidatus Sulfotelmatobacter sp.]|nr:UpxY family transcription antiterminator [Candidatus Sulfotelmatobacter sp.]